MNENSNGSMYIILFDVKEQLLMGVQNSCEVNREVRRDYRSRMAVFWVAHDIAVLWTKLCSFGNLVLKKATSQGITNLFIPLVYLLPIAYKYMLPLLYIQLQSVNVHLLI